MGEGPSPLEAYRSWWKLMEAQVLGLTAHQR